MQKIDLSGKTVLVTGAAGFIGNNLVLELLRTVDSIHVVGIDIMSDYNPVEMKEWRLEQINKEAEKHPQSSWTFIKGDIADSYLIQDIFRTYEPAVVVNLAAQAGVRYSITNPDTYIQSNLIGFYNILGTFQSLFSSPDSVCLTTSNSNCSLILYYQNCI